MTRPQNAVPVTSRPDVTAYVRQVRAHLSDLASDVVEELTGGLDADLGDLAAESDVPLEQRVGSPSVYADELRAAAELPPRPRTAGRRSQLDRFRSDLTAMHRVLAAQSWWPGTRDFLVAVRPAWWVVRALLAVWLVASVLRGPGFHTSTWVVAAVAVVVSVELGRGRWPHASVRALTAVGNVVAAVVLMVFVGTQSLGGADLRGEGEYLGAPAPTGVLEHDGSVVGNVFAYDAQGRPLSGVQLFDQDGNPLTVDPDQGPSFVRDSEGQPIGRYLVRTDVFGRPVSNAFPLAVQPLSEPDCSDGCVDGMPTPTGVPTLPAAPQASVPALAPSQGAGATLAPTTSPTTSPTTTTTSPDAGATGR